MEGRTAFVSSDKPAPGQTQDNPVAEGGPLPSSSARPFPQELFEELPVGFLHLEESGEILWGNLFAQQLLNGPFGEAIRSELAQMAQRSAEAGCVERVCHFPGLGELKLMAQRAPQGPGLMAVLERNIARRLRAETAVLSNVLAAVTQPLDEALPKALRALADTLPQTHVTLFRKEGAGVVPIASIGGEGPGAKAAASLAVCATEAGKPVHFASVARPKALAPYHSLQPADRALALALPLLSHGETWGCLYVYGPSRELAEGEIRLLQGLADALAAMLAYQAKNAALIAERHELHRAISVAKDRNHLASVGQRTAELAHELNNPLAYVRSNVFALTQALDELASQVKEPSSKNALIDDCRDILKESLHGLEHMTTLVGALKSTSQHRPNERIRFGLEGPVSQAITIFKGAKRVECEVEQELNNLPEVVGSPSAVSQVVLNLLDNGLDAMGGTGRLRVWGDCQGPWVRLHVQDFGKGIPHEVGPRIFEPFFTTKAADKGTGLGLHICRQVVEQMGGDVSFRSAPDGTTFVVRLPIANSDF